MTENTSTQTRFDAVVAAYVGADQSTKARMRADVNRAMLAAVGDLDMEAASYNRSLLLAMKSTSAPTAERPDYEGMASIRLATLRAAIVAIESGDVNLPDDEELHVDGLADDSEPDADEVARLVTFRAGRGKKVFDVSAWIGEAMLALAPEPGVAVKVSVLRTALDSAPTSGAISAAINRGDLPSGVVATTDPAGKLAVARG